MSSVDARRFNAGRPTLKHFKIRRGERAPADPPPKGPIKDADEVTTIAILGRDWPGLRPHMEVRVGARVARGQTVFTDRKHREICFVSPVSGIVEHLEFGPRRTLDTLAIRVGPDEGVSPCPPDDTVRNSPRAALLNAGFWPAFRARPFGCAPTPDATPQAILVNAVRATPQSPDPADVLADSLDEFRLGCELLTKLLSGPVHVCQSPGTPLGPEHERIRHTSFSGTVAAGLIGTQIDRLCRGMSVWSAGYQDVAAIGHYFATGAYVAKRVVSVTGPMASAPCLLRVPRGARVDDVVNTGPARALTGQSGTGRESRFLGYFDEQITLVPAVPARRGKLFHTHRTGYSAAVPSRALETAIAVDVMPIPLLHALSIGDAEAAERLGCLALVEEDLAAANRRCTSGVDYGACLRDVLDELMAEAA